MRGGALERRQYHVCGCGRELQRSNQYSYTQPEGGSQGGHYLYGDGQRRNTGVKDLADSPMASDKS